MVDEKKKEHRQDSDSESKKMSESHSFEKSYNPPEEPKDSVPPDERKKD